MTHENHFYIMDSKTETKEQYERLFQPLPEEQENELDAELDVMDID